MDSGKPTGYSSKLQITASCSRYLDPEHVVLLYMDRNPKELLNYLESFSELANEELCQYIKEVVGIPIRGHISEKFEEKWYRKHAEYLRELATECRDLVQAVRKDTSTGAAESMGFIVHQASDIVSRTRALVHSVLDNFFRLSDMVPESYGVNPANFSSHHPVWEGHATRVQGEGNPQYACSYCNTKFSGNAKDAMRHMRSRRCKIPTDTKIELDEEVNLYKQRKERLKNEKRKEGKSSKTAGSSPFSLSFSGLWL